MLFAELISLIAGSVVLEGTVNMLVWLEASLHWNLLPAQPSQRLDYGRSLSDAGQAEANPFNITIQAQAKVRPAVWGL